MTGFLQPSNYRGNNEPFTCTVQLLVTEKVDQRNPLTTHQLNYLLEKYPLFEHVNLIIERDSLRFESKWCDYTLSSTNVIVIKYCDITSIFKVNKEPTMVILCVHEASNHMLCYYLIKCNQIKVISTLKKLLSTPPTKTIFNEVLNNKIYGGVYRLRRKSLKDLLQNEKFQTRTDENDVTMTGRRQRVLQANQNRPGAFAGTFSREVYHTFNPFRRVLYEDNIYRDDIAMATREPVIKTKGSLVDCGNHDTKRYRNNYMVTKQSETSYVIPERIIKTSEVVDNPFKHNASIMSSTARPNNIGHQVNDDLHFETEVKNFREKIINIEKDGHKSNTKYINNMPQVVPQNKQVAHEIVITRKRPTSKIYNYDATDKQSINANNIIPPRSRTLKSLKKTMVNNYRKIPTRQTLGVQRAIFIKRASSDTERNSSEKHLNDTQIESESSERDFEASGDESVFHDTMPIISGGEQSRSATVRSILVNTQRKPITGEEVLIKETDSESVIVVKNKRNNKSLDGERFTKEGKSLDNRAEYGNSQGKIVLVREAIADERTASDKARDDLKEFSTNIISDLETSEREFGASTAEGFSNKKINEIPVTRPFVIHLTVNALAGTPRLSNGYLDEENESHCMTEYRNMMPQKDSLNMTDVNGKQIGTISVAGSSQWQVEESEGYVAVSDMRTSGQAMTNYRLHNHGCTIPDTAVKKNSANEKTVVTERGQDYATRYSKITDTNVIVRRANPGKKPSSKVNLDFSTEGSTNTLDEREVSQWPTGTKRSNATSSTDYLPHEIRDCEKALLVLTEFLDYTEKSFKASEFTKPSEPSSGEHTSVVHESPTSGMLAEKRQHTEDGSVCINVCHPTTKSSTVISSNLPIKTPVNTTCFAQLPSNQGGK